MTGTFALALALAGLAGLLLGGALALWRQRRPLLLVAVLGAVAVATLWAASQVAGS